MIWGWSSIRYWLVHNTSMYTNYIDQSLVFIDVFCLYFQYLVSKRNMSYSVLIISLKSHLLLILLIYGGVGDLKKSHDRSHVSDLNLTCVRHDFIWFDFWCFNATFNNISAISWRPLLVVEEAGVPGENHRPWASNW